MDCTSLAKRMCVFKLYLDSPLSESDWGGFVVPFWDSYDPEKLQAIVCDSGENRTKFLPPRLGSVLRIHDLRFLVFLGSGTLLSWLG